MNHRNYMQICVPSPPQGVSGEVVSNWIASALKGRDLPWAAVSDVDVSGSIREELLTHARESRTVATALLIERIKKAEQVVWLTAFFCDTLSTAESIGGGESYQESTEKADVALRVIDASYLYVIAPMPRAEEIATCFPEGELKVGTLEDMDFPE